MNQLATTPRRRWWRFFTQFSLRTLLILVTAAACGCWWFLRPETRDEALVGERLKLRRQVRVVKLPPPPPPEPGAPLTLTAEPENEPESILLNAGTWKILDEHDDVVVAGRYENDHPHGKWTLRHVNGRKAAEGRAIRGARAGIWKVWDIEGRPVSEVTYKTAECDVGGFLINPDGSYIEPVFGGSGFWPADLLKRQRRANQLYQAGFNRPGYVLPLRSLRHGPTRAWHPSGKLRLEGAYQDDLRSGLWSEYDTTGRLTEQGEYIDNQRHGAWKVNGTTVEYVAGLPRDQFEQLIANLKSDLSSDSLRRQVAAARQLEELGIAGRPLLIESLQHPSDDVKLLALRGLIRSGCFAAGEPDVALAEPSVEPLLDHADPRLAVRAILATYLCQPGRREDLFPRLTEKLDAAGRHDLAFETLLAVYRQDRQRRTAALGRLLEIMKAEPEERDLFYLAMPTDAVALADLGPGVIPHLADNFESGRVEMRLRVLLVLRHLVAAGESETVRAGPGKWERQWTIPPSALPLLETAKADRDPRVREAAERVGRQDLGPFNGGFGCVF